MEINRLEFDGNRITTNSGSFKVKSEIIDAYIFHQKVVILMDPDVGSRKWGQSHNLIFCDFQGNQLGFAKFPTSKSDYYYKIISRNPLKALTLSSYECEIDIDTGDILKKDFYK